MARFGLKPPLPSQRYFYYLLPHSGQRMIKYTVDSSDAFNTISKQISQNHFALKHYFIGLMKASKVDSR